jgi:hypothetical protein
VDDDVRAAFAAALDRDGPTMPHMATPCWCLRGQLRAFYPDIRTGRISQRASRLALALDGRDPGELFALHHCDNPACVRPDHLYVGTQSENMRDVARRGSRLSQLLRMDAARRAADRVAV